MEIRGSRNNSFWKKVEGKDVSKHKSHIRHHSIYLWEIRKISEMNKWFIFKDPNKANRLECAIICTWKKGQGWQEGTGLE